MVIKRQHRRVSHPHTAAATLLAVSQSISLSATQFTSRLEAHGIRISMDGRGRALDNVFVERLWRAVKYEEVYLHEYHDGWEAEKALARYFRFYCHERIHAALNDNTPAAIYFTN